MNFRLAEDLYLTSNCATKNLIWMLKRFYHLISRQKLFCFGYIQSNMFKLILVVTENLKLVCAGHIGKVSNTFAEKEGESMFPLTVETCVSSFWVIIHGLEMLFYHWLNQVMWQTNKGQYWSQKFNTVLAYIGLYFFMFLRLSAVIADYNLLMAWDDIDFCKTCHYFSVSYKTKL